MDPACLFACHPKHHKQFKQMLRAPCIFPCRKVIITHLYVSAIYLLITHIYSCFQDIPYQHGYTYTQVMLSGVVITCYINFGVTKSNLGGMVYLIYLVVQLTAHGAEYMLSKLD